MNNEDKLFELMTQMYAEMQNEFKKIREEMQDGFNKVNSRIDTVENGLQIIKTELSEFRKETNARFDTLENKLNEIEAINGSRHLKFIDELEEIKHSINRIEINTAENWRDIARLKAMRRYKIK